MTAHSEIRQKLAAPAVATPRRPLGAAFLAAVAGLFRWLAGFFQRADTTPGTYGAYRLDRKIGEGVFTHDLLALVRTSIQSHRQLTWVFAGNHEITELTHAQWSSYLVSARTIEVLPFTATETRLLLTEPLKHSPMWLPNDPHYPRFDPAFWGEGGIERIHAEAGGWPHLVQLIAETIVDLVNDEGAQHVTPGLLEQALNRAVVSGDTVLRQLLQGECRLPGEWDYLSRFRRVDVQFPPDDEAVYQSLRRRLLVAEDDGQWRLRVPLMQRWLHVRG